MAKTTHGGKRAGAGRPVTVEATERITVTLRKSDIAALDTIAAGAPRARSAAIRTLIERTHEMNIYDRQNETWETNVGHITVEEFMGERTDIEAAVTDYVQDIPQMFSDFDGDEAELAEIRELLIGYIERHLEAETE